MGILSIHKEVTKNQNNNKHMETFFSRIITQLPQVLGTLHTRNVL